MLARKSKPQDLLESLAVFSPVALHGRLDFVVISGAYFREVDRDPRWLQWLSGVDALTGRPRQVLLNDAIASTDASRVATFFRKFQQEAGSVQSQAPAAAHSRARSSGGKPVYTRSQVQQLYRAHQQGAYAGREAEWARLEVDIVAAGREGRNLNPVDLQGK